MNLPSTRRATGATESTKLSLSEWATVFGDAKITALLDRLTHRRHIMEAAKRQLPLQG